MKNILAVAAGKGGVGKSTVSVNVAMALHRLGAKVALLDADIYGPSVPKMLGTPERETSTTLAGDRISLAMYRGIPVMSVAFFVEPGNAVVWRGPMIHKLLKQFLEDVEWGEIDYLIVDLPPGTGDAQLSLAQLIPITGSIMVTTPQEVALHRRPPRGQHVQQARGPGRRGGREHELLRVPVLRPPRRDLRQRRRRGPGPRARRRAARPGPHRQQRVLRRRVRRAGGRGRARQRAGQGPVPTWPPAPPWRSASSARPGPSAAACCAR